jgi:hypothetical protein
LCNIAGSRNLQALRTSNRRTPRQAESQTCGYVMIAVLTDLIFGIDPSTSCYDQAPMEMQGHLLKCFQEGKLSPFPRLCLSDIDEDKVFLPERTSVPFGIGCWCRLANVDVSSLSGTSADHVQVTEALKSDTHPDGINLTQFKLCEHPRCGVESELGKVRIHTQCAVQAQKTGEADITLCRHCLLRCLGCGDTRSDADRGYCFSCLRSCRVCKKIYIHTVAELKKLKVTVPGICGIQNCLEKCLNCDKLNPQHKLGETRGYCLNCLKHCPDCWFVGVTDEQAMALKEPKKGSCGDFREGAPECVLRCTTRTCVNLQTFKTASQEQQFKKKKHRQQCSSCKNSARV